VADFVHHSTVSRTQLADGVKVVIFQLSDLRLLREEGLQTLPLLLVQVQLSQLLLQGLKVRPVRVR